MDPNINQVLRELRGLLAIPNHTTIQRMRVAELFSIIDSQLSNGGRLPDEWADAIRPLTGRGKHQCSVCGEVHYLPMCRTEDDEEYS